MTNHITDPKNFPWRVDVQRSVIEFLNLDRDKIAEAAFLDHQAPGANGPKTSEQISTLQKVQATASPPARLLISFTRPFVLRPSLAVASICRAGRSL